MTSWSLVVARSVPQPDDHRERIATWNETRARALFPDTELVLSDPRYEETVITPTMPFDHAEAMNHGARHATGDVLVLMDCDTFINPGAIDPAVSAAAEGGWAMCRWYAQLAPDATDRLLDGDPCVTVLPVYRRAPYSYWVGDSVSWAGFVVIRRDVFLDVVKGYDERLSGWAPDDIAFGLTASALVGPPTRVEETVWHLWHEPTYLRDHGWTDEKHAVKNAYLDAADDPDKIRAVMAGKP